MLQCLQGIFKSGACSMDAGQCCTLKLTKTFSPNMGCVQQQLDHHIPNLPNHTTQTVLLHILPKSLTCYMRQTLPLLVSNGLQ